MSRDEALVLSVDSAAQGEVTKRMKRKYRVMRRIEEADIFAILI